MGAKRGPEKDGPRALTRLATLSSERAPLPQQDRHGLAGRAAARATPKFQVHGQQEKDRSGEAQEEWRKLHNTCPPSVLRREDGKKLGNERQRREQDCRYYEPGVIPVSERRHARAQHRNGSDKRGRCDRRGESEHGVNPRADGMQHE